MNTSLYRFGLMLFASVLAAMIAPDSYSVMASSTLSSDNPRVYSTYIGGKGWDKGEEIAVDASGNVYIAGETNSENFPTRGALQNSPVSSTNSFITKFSSTGEVVYSTYLRGSRVTSMAADAYGNLYVAGIAEPQDFQTTPGALQTARKVRGAFIAKLSGAGDKLIYSTYLGGSGDHDWITALAVDESGNAYVAGSIGSTDFPLTTDGALQRTYSGSVPYSLGGFVAKVDARGSSLIYSTYLGNSRSGLPDSMAIDRTGNAYVAGKTEASDPPQTYGGFQNLSDSHLGIFIARLNATGNKVFYSAYNGNNVGVSEEAIAVDSSGSVYVTGYAYSKDFPTTRGAFQSTWEGKSHKGFVLKLNEQGNALVYSTLLGDETGGYGITVDSSGRAYVTGGTRSGKFPTTPDAFQRKFEGGFKRFNFGDFFYNEDIPPDAFVSVLSQSGDQLVYSTYVGAWDDEDGRAIAIDEAGNIYVTGETQSKKFPASRQAFQKKYGGYTDAFFLKITRR